MAITLNTYGQLLEEQGREETAEAFYLRSQAISEKAQDPAIAYAWYSLGKLYRRQGRYAEAEDYLKRTLAVGESRLPDDHALLGPPLLELANVYRDQERYAEAEPLYQRTLAIWQKALPPGDRRLERTHRAYAQLLEATGRSAGSEGH